MDNKDKFKIDIPLIIQSSALIVMGFYVVGFVVVNSYLSKIGMYSFDPLNARYVSAGILTAVVFAIFGITFVRKFHNISSDCKEMLLKLGPSRIWGLFIIVHAFAKLAFFCVLDTFITISIFFEGFNFIDHKVYYITLFTGFLIDYGILERGGLYRKYPQAGFPVSLFIFLAVIYVGTFTVKDPRIYKLYYFYFGIMFAVSCYFLVSENVKFDRIGTIFFGVVASVSAAAMFGNFFYGEIRREVGGGYPLDIRVVATGDMPQYLIDKLRVQNGVSGNLKLLSETNDDLVILSGKSEEMHRGLRFRKRYVSAIIPLIESEYVPVNELPKK